MFRHTDWMMINIPFGHFYNKNMTKLSKLKKYNKFLIEIYFVESYDTN